MHVVLRGCCGEADNLCRLVQMGKGMMSVCRIRMDLVVGER